jgi:hypothetical protein
MMAIGNPDELFLLRILRETRADRDADPKLSELHHFEAPMPFAGDVLRVKIPAVLYRIATDRGELDLRGDEVRLVCP